VRFKTEFKRG